MLRPIGATVVVRHRPMATGIEAFVAKENERNQKMKKLAKKLLTVAMAACFTIAIVGCGDQGGVQQCPGGGKCKSGQKCPPGKKCPPAGCAKKNCCKKKAAAPAK